MWNSRLNSCQFAALPTATGSTALPKRIKKHALLSLHGSFWGRRQRHVCAAIREGISRTNTCLQLFDSVDYEPVCSSPSRLVHRRQLLQLACRWSIGRKKTPSDFALGEGWTVLTAEKCFLQPPFRFLGAMRWGQGSCEYDPGLNIRVCSVGAGGGLRQGRS